ncbi:SusC/RagA family TonB-linked outer membrane protein [Pedobacter sp. P351]|uniref:SusC/RagA family TonB-linked outer membrane protein n=1 Tax=Pedobacter superstes TaxID=3133441 RepID=UPI0030955E1D
MQSIKIKKVVFTILAMIFCIALNAQERKVTGAVVDLKDGFPLPGVSIKVKGQQRSATTDDKGNYSIMADPKTEILVFSYLGYRVQEVNVSGKTAVNISLETDSKLMEEVVVVGYGVKTRSEILGSVATITGKELEDIPAPTIAAALRDRIAGVGVSVQSGRPGADINLNIRNSRVSTTSAGYGVSTEPLYIIDGITVGGDQFDALDASMVETITILKDASAAIYGSAGAKGVVLITTKRGKPGKPRFSANSYVGISDASYTPPMLSAYEHASLLNQQLDLKGDAAFANYFSQEDLDYLKNSNIKSWREELWQAAITQKHNINMSGGTENLTFSVGGNYQNENANYADMKKDSYGFRTGLVARIGESIKVDVGFNVNSSNKFSKNGLNKTDNTYYTNLMMTPLWIPIQVDGKPVNHNGIKNPLAIINSGFFSRDVGTNYSINTAVNFTPKFIPGLVASLRVSQSGANGNSETYTAPYKQYTFAKTGNLGLFYRDSVISVQDGVAPKDARLNPSLSKGSSWQGTFTLNYNKAIKKHNITAMVTGETSRSYNEGIDMYWGNQIVSGIEEYWGFDQTAITFRSREKSDGIKESYLSRLSYNYDGKYMLELTGRMDASSNFGLKNVWGKFGNVGVGWNIGNENFFKDNVKFINSLKLRVNYGITGDDRVTAKLWQERYGIDLVNSGYLYNNSSQPTFNPSIIPNPNITWESAKTLNGGADLSLLNDKLTFQFDIFHRWSLDGFDKNGNDNFPMYVGFIAPVVNNFERRTWGTEFSMGYRTTIAKKLRFNSSINFGLGNSMVTQTFYNKYELFLNTYPDWITSFGVKENQWGNFGYISTGIMRSQEEVDALLKDNPNYTIIGKVPEVGWLNFKDINQDGKISEEDKVQMFKHPNPASFGINLGFGYKSFDLRANVAADIGGKVFYDSRAQDEPTLTRNASKFFAVDRWTPENPDGKFPRLDDPGSKDDSDFWAVSGTMIRINNMTLSYTVPKNITSKLGISNFRILATGNNLWTLVNPLPYKDPYSGNMYDYPTLRTISMGLSVGF